MGVFSAIMSDIEIKPAGKSSPAKMITNINLEIGSGAGAMGTLVTVRVSTPLVPETTTLSEMQNALAEKVHRVLQEAAASSVPDLKALLANSLKHDPDR